MHRSAWTVIGVTPERIIDGHDHLFPVQVYRVRLKQKAPPAGAASPPPTTFELLRPPLLPAFPQTGLRDPKAPDMGTYRRRGD
jgi:hypothetical protein